MYNYHTKDKLLKRCPFCGGKATLRSPKRLRDSRRNAICSDVTCVKCGVHKASWPWPNYEDDPSMIEFPRDVQDDQVIKEWNKRK